jgi:hypothetical protein
MFPTCSHASSFSDVYLLFVLDTILISCIIKTGKAFIPFIETGETGSCSTTKVLSCVDKKGKNAIKQVEIDDMPYTDVGEVMEAINKSGIYFLLHSRHINRRFLPRRIFRPPQRRDSLQPRVKLHTRLAVKIQVPDNRISRSRKRKHWLWELVWVAQTKGTGMGTFIPT